MQFPVWQGGVWGGAERTHRERSAGFGSHASLAVAVFCTQPHFTAVSLCLRYRLPPTPGAQKPPSLVKYPLLPSIDDPLSCRSVYYREHAAGMYHSVTYSLAELLVELPYIAVQSMVASLIIYWQVLLPACAAWVPACVPGVW